MNGLSGFFTKKKARAFARAACSALCGCILLISAANAVVTNNPGDIGNFGSWATEHNKELLTNKLSADMGSFQGKCQDTIIGDCVPVEARVGKAFIGALNRIGVALQRSLFDFVQILLVALFAFWIGFEAYNLIKSQGDAKKLGVDVAKKAVLVSVWLWVLSNDPGRIFMTVFGPIISAGAYMSDLILDSIASAAGANLPDTCAAIRDFVGPDDMHTADLLCMPTRLSGFFYTCVSAGFKWMAAGIGNSALTFVAGAVFVVIFMMNIWKFALLALGVIADLFFAILLLPFTSIQECFGKGTSLNGIAADIFKGFAGIFKYAGLNEQMQRFIRAVIYFIVLSIVAAIGAALLGGVVRSDLSAAVPTLESDGFMPVLIVGCLVSYLVNKASEIAANLGGKIDDSFGRQAGEHAKKLCQNTKKQVSDWRKIFKANKK